MTDDSLPRSGTGLSGLAALTRAAIEARTTLAPKFNAYVGSTFVTGLVAPPSWFVATSRNAQEAEIKQVVESSMRRKASEVERQNTYNDLIGDYLTSYRSIESAQSTGTDIAELTLVDVSVLPAVGTQGTKSAGHTLPVVRIPYASVDLWWFVDGDAIKGSAGWSGSFGVLFPIGE